MSAKIMSFRQLVDLWPSVAEFAKDLRCRENTAHVMRFRDSIHSRWWAQIVEGAKRRRIKGITFEVLARLQAEKKITAAASARHAA